MTEIRPGMGYRTIDEIPVPEDVEAFLTREGVPLNTRLFPGNSGTGRIQGQEYSFGGISMNNYFTNAQREKFLKQERLKFLYRMLKWWGYFDTPVAQRRPIAELLGTNPRREFTWNQYMSPRYQAPTAKPVYLPVEYAGGPLYMNKGSLSIDPINQEEFVNGEKVNVLYTKDQLKQLNKGKKVSVKPSMIYRPGSVNSMLERGSLVNPMTREKVELRQRRTLHFKNKKNETGAGAGAGTNSNSNSNSNANSVGGKRSGLSKRSKRKTRKSRTRRNQ